MRSKITKLFVVAAALVALAATPAAAVPDSPTHHASTVEAASVDGVQAGAGTAVAMHASSSEASYVCNATMPAGVSGDVVLHAHLTGLLVGARDYTCESWNFVSGSGSHGAYWHAWFVFACSCAFGPFNAVIY